MKNKREKELECLLDEALEWIETAQISYGIVKYYETKALTDKIKKALDKKD